MWHSFSPPSKVPDHYYSFVNSIPTKANAAFSFLRLPLVFSYCPVPRHVGDSVTQCFLKNPVAPSGLQSGIVQLQTPWRHCHSKPLLVPTPATPAGRRPSQALSPF
ncbi:hypothetical protein AVEN_250327-1 [Araneus ventricosus]|uniref:Uncharacterized protein n=1 Tax=Araneus ventricosus TaxID=182803 RepID=A0A4Y2TWD2_ARAVE|nr:hypothetical protein AVEN_250327-1 [Araneus ventricosus]